jgi:catechol 2,3-dioxygenase-like lactoylglutathione lyase family enzyme
VTIRASDRESSERFYETALRTLGIAKTRSGEHFAAWGDFSLAQASADRPVTRYLHIGFVAPSRENVDEFWRVGTQAGYPDDDEPGPRPQYSPDYYGSFLLDPNGNSVEAVHRETHRRGPIDHLWIRVGDLAASTRFYETVAPQTGFRLRHETGDRAAFVGEDGSFTIVSGTPTEGLHMAFSAAENATVEEFHRVATAAGYADNGIPGERLIYHAGYYGAFILDPDGNNIEVVNHNR